MEISTEAATRKPSPWGPRSAKRSSLLGKLTGGGLGKPLGLGEGVRNLILTVTQMNTTAQWKMKKREEVIFAFCF
jgi:hypothetical protein